MILLLQVQAAGTVSQLQWYLSAVDQLVSTAGPILVPVAQQWGAMFAVGH